MNKNLIKNFEKDHEKHISNEKYDLYYKYGELLETGITNLKVGQETTGHSHDNVEEVYLFVSGKGKLEIDKEMFEISKGDVFIIPEGAFHKVYNTGKEKLLFFVVFNK